MKVALVIPTRGVLFARTVQSTILSDELPPESPVIIVEGLPIPDAHNECIRRALETDCTHILFVEEDMELPKDALNRMLQEAVCGRRIVCMDYLVRPTIPAISYDDKGPFFFGFGCTLFDRTLFEKEFSTPWLTDKYSILIEGKHRYSVYENKPNQELYGKYDVYFGYQCRQKGIDIYVIPDMMCTHLRMKSWERKETNKGAHDIYEI